MESLSSEKSAIFLRPDALLSNKEPEGRHYHRRWFDRGGLQLEEKNLLNAQKNKAGKDFPSGSSNRGRVPSPSFLKPAYYRMIPALLRGAILLMALSESAVIVSEGFTPGFADIIDPSQTYIFW